MPADLHCHSICSDGATSIENIFRLARLNGLNAVAITDHDTFIGIEKAKKASEKYNVRLVAGVEISTFDYNRNRMVHILCYNCKKPELFNEIFETTAKNRYNAVMGALEKIKTRYSIDKEMVEELAKESSTVFKSHIMQALMIAGYTDKMYGDLFKELFSWKTGFAKTDIIYPDVYEIIDLIHKAGGIAVLAHPSVYDTIPAIPSLIEAGIDGIECWYPRATDEDTKALLEYTEKHNLLRTGGTDFHGYSCGNVNPIGTCTTPDEDLERLIEFSK